MVSNNLDIWLRPTEEKDLDTVLKMERDPSNTPFIRQWTLKQHKNSLSDAHYGHFIVEDEFLSLRHMSIPPP